jgi:hypothetical protein
MVERISRDRRVEPIQPIAPSKQTDSGEEEKRAERQLPKPMPPGGRRKPKPKEQKPKEDGKGDKIDIEA